MPPQPRVAFVTYAMQCGGMEAALLRLGTYLREQGSEVEILTTIEPGEWFGRVAEVHLKAHHIAGYDQLTTLAPLLHSLRVRRKLIAGNYDVIFLNHDRHAQAGLARLPEHVVAIPILHNDVDEIYEVGCGNQNAWNVAVAVSPKVASRARHTVPNRPVVEIPYGVEAPSAAVWESRRKFSTPLELIFIGRLDHTQKGILWLPEIYRACLDRGMEATLTIVGDGPDAQRLDRKLAQYDLQNTVRRARGLTPEQVYGVLLQSHILLMPSYYEGLPIALMESLVCGCVPVVSRLPGITDVMIENGKTGMLVDVEHVAGFVEAIATIYNDPRRWANMSSAAHEVAQHKYSVEAMGRSYLDLITDALNGSYPLPRARKHQRALDLSVFSWRNILRDRARHVVRQGRAWLRGSTIADSRNGRRR
jgi:glycosyltransferase involved in cell wall biosynthesis